MRWSRLLCMCWPLIVSCSHDDSHLFFADAPFPVLLPGSEQEVRLELLAEYGDQDHGLVFGHITDLAVSETGVLAVLDRIDCRVWILDTETRETRSLGGCGDGPGEFRIPRVAAFTGDTLVVFDSGRNSLQKITLEGDEIDRLPLPLATVGAFAVSDLYVGDGGSIVAGLDLLPPGLDSEHLQIAVFEGTGGAVIHRGLVAPPVARATRRSAVREGSLCGGVMKDGVEFLAAVNTWGPQLTVLRRSDFHSLLSARVPVLWAQAMEDPPGSGAWVNFGPVPGIACGERHIVVGYRSQSYEGGRVSEVLRSVLVAIDLEEGSLTIFGGDQPPEPGSILFMTPAAALEDRFFFFTNAFFGHPTVREYRIAPGGVGR
jgi:hypothetical protein